MSNIGPIADKSTKTRVINKCWNYLDRHFSNLSEVNKLKVILTICGKNVPQEIKGEGFTTSNINIINPENYKKDKSERLRLAPESLPS